MTILAVGDVSLDLTLRVERLPEPDEKLVVDESIEQTGGVVANFAVAASRLGASVRLSARLGDDVAGRSALTGMQAAGIDLSAIRVDPRAQTYRTVSVVDPSGEKRLFLLPGASLYPAADDLTDGLFEGAGWMHTAAYDYSACRRAVELATARDVSFSLDVEPATIAGGLDGMAALLAGADTVFVNIRAISLLGPDAESVYRRLHDLGVLHVVHTQGAAGARIASADGTRAVVQEVPHVEVVDTTGAGDAFAAAYVVARDRGDLPLQAVRAGVVAGALACRGLGAQGSLPGLDDIERHLRSSIGATE